MLNEDPNERWLAIINRFNCEAMGRFGGTFKRVSVDLLGNGQLEVPRERYIVIIRMAAVVNKS